MKKKDCPRKTCNKEESKTNKTSIWSSKLVSATVLTAAVISFGSGMPAVADLNKFEAATRGEFGIGSAAQFGSADLRYFFFFFTSLFIYLLLCGILGMFTRIIDSCCSFTYC